MPAPSNHSNNFLGKVKQSFVALYETLVATLHIAGKRMERWNIRMDLPKMYLPLGKEIHSAGRFRNEFPEVFSVLDSHQKELDALERGEATDGDQSDEAQQAAAKRKEGAARFISGKMNTEYERLGQLAWEKHSEASGPAALVAPIRQARQRQETLTTEIESIRASFASRRLTPKRLVFGAAGCLVVFVLLLPQAIRDARETQRRRDAERLAAAEVDAPQQTEATEKASGSLARYTVSQQEAIASDPRLRTAHDMGHLDSAKLGNYLRVKSEMQRKGLDVESGTGINFLFLTLIPSEDWPTAARRLGLSREEYRHATNMAMGTAGVALHEFDSERERLTGESLDEYAEGGESIRRSSVPTTTDDFLEQLRQITGGQYIDMRGPFREGNSTEYGVLMGHPPSDPSNAVDSDRFFSALGKPDLAWDEEGSSHVHRWSYHLTDGSVRFRVFNYDALRDKGLQPDGGILVDGSSIKVVIE